MKIISNPVQISDRQRGFTLLEVLIAVMLLAVGLLGLAGLQAVSLRNNHSAYLRSQATMLTYEVIDGMRTNRSAAQAGNYDIAIGTAASASPPDCMAIVCTGSEMATDEIADWKQSLANLMPSGDGAVARAGNVVTVTVQWMDERDADPAKWIKQFAMSTEAMNTLPRYRSHRQAGVRSCRDHGRRHLEFDPDGRIGPGLHRQ